MLLSEKLDGMRALWHQGRLWSRQGNALHAPPSFTAALPQHCTLDGELHMGRGRFSETMTVTRGQAASEERWRGVQYAVFDAPLAPGGFAARLAAAGAALAEGRRAAEAAAGGAVESFAALLPHTPCAGPEDLALQLQAMVAAGGEGLMLRNPDALFSESKSTRRPCAVPPLSHPPPSHARTPFHPPPLPPHTLFPPPPFQPVGARMTC